MQNVVSTFLNVVNFKVDVQRCFNVDLALCDVAISYQPKSNVEPTLKCLLGMFLRSCTFTCFLINADANVNKIVFPLSSTHFRNDFLSNSYENITFNIQKKQAHINLILLSQLIQTLDCTSIFIYPVSAVGSIRIPNSNTGFGHKIHVDTAIFKI